MVTAREVNICVRFRVKRSENDNVNYRIIYGFEFKAFIINLFLAIQITEITTKSRKHLHENVCNVIKTLN